MCLSLQALPMLAHACTWCSMILIRQLQECLSGSHLHALQANPFSPCICFLAVSQLPVQMAVADAVQTTQTKDTARCMLMRPCMAAGAACTCCLLIYASMDTSVGQATLAATC